MNRNQGTAGIGFCQLLTILFIALKLNGTINWSWLWVLSPLWIPLGVAVACGIIYFALSKLGV